MSDNRLPTEVELAYEVMPCNAARSVQEPGKPFAHSCAYFRQWGRYHSYDYREDGPPPEKGIVHLAQYVGRAALVPELLSGCRKAPIMAVGINPNLPGWSVTTRNTVHPLFDDYKQYAHYFRYRTTAKLRVPTATYKALRGQQDDSPLRDFELNVPGGGAASLEVELLPVKMYENYQALLEDLAARMGWTGHKLSIGEDVSYGNMVACPSAKWITQPPDEDPAMPPMATAQRQGIVGECFHERRYFLRQLFQSLPSVLMIFSQSTTDAFLGEMQGHFSLGNPQPGDKISDLLEREIRLRYGQLADGAVLEARVIFSPHITGTPSDFAQARAKVLAQLVQEAQAGRLQINPDTGHLSRPRGSCVFCTMLEVGPCDYEDELRAMAPGVPGLLAVSASPDPVADKKTQNGLLSKFLRTGEETAAAPELAGAAPAASAADMGWTLSGDPTRQADRDDAGHAVDVTPTNLHD